MERRKEQVKADQATTVSMSTATKGMGAIDSAQLLLGLDYVYVYACSYNASMLASMMHLWATIRSIVTCNELTTAPLVCHNDFILHSASKI
jgi:hypothetical protein